MATTIRTIEEKLESLDANAGERLIYDLLLIYDQPKSSVTRLQNREGGLNKALRPNEVLWKKKVYDRYLPDASGSELLHALSEAQDDEAIQVQQPRFLVVRNKKRLLAIDAKTGDSLDTSIELLVEQAMFFGPLARLEKRTVENANPADVKAAQRMAKLYDEIVKVNEIKSDGQVHALNVFFARVLFCFFAEDTEVFESGLFSGLIATYSADDGSDLAELLTDLFVVLDTAPADRSDLPERLRSFGYVNGSLFAEDTEVPTFSRPARRILLECAELDWAEINPDIFGSMIQAVVHPSQRSGFGMHYTSPENIMKVLNPLFLDSLNAEFDDAYDNASKLAKLLDRTASIKVFDPACGSGNFLIVAYKELRRLEHRTLLRKHEVETGGLAVGMAQTLFPDPRVKLENFFGVEIDDFAHEIATLSLWLAKHQLNLEFKELFDRNIPLIPLKDTGKLVRANATRVDWAKVCPVDTGEVFVCGNPPYIGSSMQTEAQKDDFTTFFGTSKYPRNLDYISLWFFKGAEYIHGHGAALAFVTTNSVSQGDHVALMWPRVFDIGMKITFAYQSFAWSNSAKGNAGVTVAIVGLADIAPNPAIYSGDTRQSVDVIGPYLTRDPRRTVVRSSRSAPDGLPPMVFGSKPTDGGNLNLTPSERDALVAEAPESARFIRKYAGAQEFINGIERYCLWIADDEFEQASSIAPLAARFERVRAMRLAGSAPAKAMANRPYRFLQRAHSDGAAIIVPRVSSERREYIPMGFLGPDTVISDAANAIYGAEPWVFGLIQSRVHMTWVRAVAGRLKTDIRYSAVLCYNTFPVPQLAEDAMEQLIDRAVKVLSTRGRYSGNTLAELYDREKMPQPLRDAHRELDETVDSIYAKSGKPFTSDEERLERLLDLYALASGETYEFEQSELEPADA